MRRIARNRPNGFTLIELLTVIAITAVLLTIIVVPVIQTFNLLRTAQAYSDAQEQARVLLDRISREISDGSGVRDNSGDKGAVAVVIPTGNGSPQPTATRLLPYTKLDIVEPAQGQPQLDASGNITFVDPVTGKVDPTLHRPKGQVVLPVTPGSTLVRYFIGLRDPFFNAAAQYQAGSYNNPYDGLLMQRNGQRDNLFVLYRAEVQPFIWGSTGYQVNSSFFATDANGRIVLDDPYFFIPDGTQAKATRIQNWLKQAVVVTQVSRYDMVMPVYNKSTRAVVYDVDGAGNQVPRLVPVIQFRPTRISDAPSNVYSAVRLGEESDNPGLLGSDVIRTQFGGWSSSIVRTWGPPDPNTGQQLPHQVGLTGTRADNTVGFSIFNVVNPTGNDTTGGTELFDVDTYSGGVANSTRYPFSAGVAAANARSNFINDAASMAFYMAYSPDPNAGKILASFGINEVGIAPLPPTAADPTGSRPNLPILSEGTNETPGVVGNGVGTVTSWGTAAINDRFFSSWFDFPNLRGTGVLQRFVDLRVVPNEDGTFGPLFPSNAKNIAGNVVISGNGARLGNPSIVPGSEQVFGPDQNPGPNFGAEVRYTRTTRAPGPNQYRIVYVKQPEPNYAALGLTAGELAGFDPTSYDANNFVSAAIQAQYEPGYIELNSDPNVALPTTLPIRVFYRFQFTGPQESFQVDYDSRQVMSLLLTIHNYPQTSLPNPQTVTLKSTATVRNFLR